jgi:heterodisulfide reductase subunit C
VGKDTAMPAKNANQKTGSVGFLEQVEEASSQKVRVCYQCGKCSAGCPVAYAMDLLPNQVMRLVQLGLQDEALSCSTIWLCLKQFGRLYEAALIGVYNLRSGHLTKDLGKAPGMLLKGKIALLPPRVKGMAKVRKIIKKVEEVSQK